MEIVIHDLVLLGLGADVLGGGHAVEVHLVKDGALGAHPGVLGAADAVVEDLAAHGGVGVVAVLLGRARELGLS